MFARHVFLYAKDSLFRIYAIENKHSFPAQSVRLFLRTLLGFIIKAFDENCGARFCRVFFFALVFFFLGTFFPHAQLVTNFPRKQIRW